MLNLNSLYTVIHSPIRKVNEMIIYVLMNDWLTGEPNDLRSFDNWDEFENMFNKSHDYEYIIRMWIENK